MNTLFRYSVLVALLVAGTLHAAERKPLFRDTTPLKAVLTAPIAQAYAQRHSDVRLYFPGQWAYIDENGETQRLQVAAIAAQFQEEGGQGYVVQRAGQAEARGPMPARH